MRRPAAWRDGFPRLGGQCPETGRRPACPGPGTGSPRWQAEMARLDRQARALEQAGRQLKALWAEHNRWPAGADAYPAAARLSLVAYLMGETPVFSCASGRDCNKRLDTEAKILATVTDCQGGQVPPADLDTGIWDTARAAFPGAVEEPRNNPRPGTSSAPLAGRRHRWGSMELLPSRGIQPSRPPVAGRAGAARTSRCRKSCVSRQPAGNPRRPG